MIKKISFIIALLMPVMAIGDISKFVDYDGRIYYTDKPKNDLYKPIIRNRPLNYSRHLSKKELQLKKKKDQEQEKLKAEKEASIASARPLRPLTKEDMDAADKVCLYQTLDSKHKGINATSAIYNKDGMNIDIVCSDSNKLTLPTAMEQRAIIIGKELNREHARLKAECEGEVYKLNHLSVNVGTMKCPD